MQYKSLKRVIVTTDECVDKKIYLFPFGFVSIDIRVGFYEIVSGVEIIELNGELKFVIRIGGDLHGLRPEALAFKEVGDLCSVRCRNFG